MFIELWKRNLSIVPVQNKRCFISGWDKYCSKMPTEEEVISWDSMYKPPKYGVGITLGSANNGLMCIDIDSIDNDLISFLKNLLPESPIRKIGRRPAWFYRAGSGVFYSAYTRDNISSDKDISPTEQVEILTGNRQSVIPPSVHQITGEKYYYESQGTFGTVDIKDLPIFRLDHQLEIAKYMSKFSLTSKDGKSMIGSGRNNELTRVVCAILSKYSENTDEEISKELIEIDNNKHSNPYFKDIKEAYYNNAIGFVKEHRLRMLKKGMISSNNSPAPQINIENLLSKKQDQETEFPKTTGMIHVISKVISNRIRSLGQEEMATGGAIAICSVLAANRFHINGVAAQTAQYVMCVAGTGSGKGASIKVASSLFNNSKLRRFNLMGLTNYSSGAAFVEHLKEQRTRLDIIDEFSVYLKGLMSGSQFIKETEGMLCSIYNIEDEKFEGHNTKGQNKQGACYSPEIGLLANIQRETLEASATPEMLASGFLARFLVTSYKNDMEFNERHTERCSLDEIAAECARIFPDNMINSTVGADGSIVTDLGDVRPTRYPLVVNEQAKKFFTEIDREFHYQRNKYETNGDTVRAMLISRHAEMIQRLAITNAVCNDRREIILSDYEYAKSVIYYCANRSAEYFKLIDAKTPEKKNIEKVFRVISKCKLIGHSDLSRKSDVTGRNLQVAIDALIEQERIVIVRKDRPKQYALL